jgi:adenylate kinase
MSSASKNFILLGPPGAGKGTQAAFLTNTYGLQKVDTGSLLRQAIANPDSDLGKQAKSYVAEGKLVPDSLVISLVLQEIEVILKKGHNFLLDGFPRNLVQAQALDSELLQKGINLDKAILISIDSSKLLERIVGRRICSNKDCGAVYHLQFSPPKEQDVCDLCASALYQRDDDKEELVQSRLETYLTQTKPLIDFYKHKNILIEIDGNKSSAEVSGSIAGLLS